MIWLQSLAVTCTLLPSFASFSHGETCSNVISIGHHRGGSRRGMQRVHTTTTTPPPPHQADMWLFNTTLSCYNLLYRLVYMFSTVHTLSQLSHNPSSWLFIYIPGSAQISWLYVFRLNWTQVVLMVLYTMAIALATNNL